LSQSGVVKYWVLAVVSLSTFMVFVDATVVNTALPSIARDFGASNSALQWIVNSYSLLVVGLLLLGGTVGDRFGRKRAMIGGVLIFGAASLGASLSPDSSSLIVMRGFQGVGAAFMLPATLSIISNVFEHQERARAIAVWAMVGAVAAVAGPALGGFLVDQFSWESVVLLHLPIVAVILAGMKIVPESKDSRKRPLDVTGAVLATGGMLAVVFGIVQGGESGWTSIEIIGAFLGGCLLLTAFGISQARNLGPPLHVEGSRSLPSPPP
jgi:MFS family permease